MKQNETAEAIALKAGFRRIAILRRVRRGEKQTSVARSLGLSQGRVNRMFHDGKRIEIRAMFGPLPREASTPVDVQLETEATYGNSYVCELGDDSGFA